MQFTKLCVAAAVALAATVPLSAQPSAVVIDGDDVMMRGCVTASNAPLMGQFETLLWSRGGILTAGTLTAAHAPRGTVAQRLTGRVFYWVRDRDLARHVGQLVEVRGDLEEIERGEIEFDRDGAFTEIKLELDGMDRKIRVPTAWLYPIGSGEDDDVEFDIVARRIDIDDIRVLGAC